jgi:hypothetical protein
MKFQINCKFLCLGPTYKKSIDNIAEMLCDKLEALEVHAIDISPLKLLAIQIEVSFLATQKLMFVTLLRP